MGTITPLKDRIDDRRKGEVIDLRKQPAWIRRMQERGLPQKDMTSYLTSYRPGPDAA